MVIPVVILTLAVTPAATLILPATTTETDFVSFAALDCAMFLDTHPKNAEGLEYFEYYTNARKQALKEYSSRFSPLTLDTVPKGTDFWAWANEPWPWEMEG